MSEKKPDQKLVTIASVTAGNPPGRLTLDEWQRWRKEEDERMRAEMERQREEHFAATLAQLERDLNGETLQ